MFEKIIPGQYYATDSVIHQLDPRVKLFGAFWYSIMLLFCEEWRDYVCAIIFLMIIILLTKIPFLRLLRGVAGIGLLLGLAAWLHLFLTPGKTIWHWWCFSITKEGVLKAENLVLRLVLLVLFCSLLTFTTSVTEIAAGLEKAFGFLYRIKIPVGDIAMIVSLALCFVPRLMEEADMIIRAQKARGASFKTGGLRKRIQSLLPVLIPLFAGAVRRAERMAVAMEARGYGGEKRRTRMYPLQYKGRDYIACLILIGYGIVMCLITIV